MLEKLKEMDRLAKTASPYTCTLIEFSNELVKHWPKLLAMGEAVKELDLKCDDEDVLRGEPACGDCKICRVNIAMADL